MTLNQLKADYSSLFFDAEVVTLHETQREYQYEQFDRNGDSTIKFADDTLYHYTIGNFTSSNYQSRDQAYLAFYELFISKWTNSDFSAWPYEECILNEKISNGLTIRLNDLVLCDFIGLGLDARTAQRVMNHAIEFAIADATIENTQEYPLINMECLYKALALTYGMGLVDHLPVQKIETQLPTYVRRSKVFSALGGAN